MEFATRPHMNNHHYGGVLAGPPRAGPQVPAGWAARFNEQYQTWFYVNVHTEQSQWEQPSGPVFPPGVPSTARYSYVPSTTYHESDEELARRLQAEENAANGMGRNDGPPPPQPPRPRASSYDPPPTYSLHPVASSPCVPQLEPYGNGSGNYFLNSGHYPQGGGYYPPGGNANPFPQPPSPNTQQRRGGKDRLIGKVIDKVGNKVPLAADLGAAAGYGAVSAPSSRPSSSHGYHPQQHGAPTYSLSNGNLAPPTNGAAAVNGKEKSKKKWAVPLAAGAGGGGLLGAGAFGCFAAHSGKGKLGNSGHSDGGWGLDGSGWGSSSSHVKDEHDPWGMCGCSKCQKKLGKVFKHAGDGDEDDNGDDGGDGGGDDGGDGGEAIGEALGAVFGF